MSCAHEHDHNHDPGDHLPPPNSNASQSLYPYIDHDNVIALNESQDGSGAKIVRKYSERLETEPLLESDVDEELLILIPFTGLVQLKSIQVRSTADDRAPKVIRLFKNRDDLDFATASELKPMQTLHHPAGVGIGTRQDDGIVEYALSRPLFSNMTSLTIHISENHGNDVTALSYIGLTGSWTKLNKAPVVAMYEAAANPKDHKVKGDELHEAAVQP